MSARRAVHPVFSAGARTWLLGALLALLLAARPGAAGSVELDAPRAVYPGIPFEIRLVIVFDRDHGPPNLPEVAGLSLGRPSRTTSQQIGTINGRLQTIRSATYTWTAQIDEARELTLPAIEVSVDGEKLRTEPIRMVATEADGGERVIAEIVADRPFYYLGESFDVTLELSIKAYRDRQFPVEWRPENSWDLVDQRGSRWGPFAPALGGRSPLDLFAEAAPIPPHRQVMRPNDAGEPVPYHQFRFTVPFEPAQAGPIEIGPVAIAVRYPTRLERSSRGLRIAAREPLLARPAATSIEVRTPPAEGRPSAFSGAVGRYAVSARADVHRAAVGDPIVLELTVVDRTPGRRSLATLQPPRIDLVGALTDDFQVAADALAGEVSGRAKVFHPVLRARRSDVTAIPPIPFAFFDPEQEAYVVAYTEPIPLEIDPAVTLAMSDVVGADAAAPVGGGLTEVEGGLRANDEGPAVLVSVEPLRLGAVHLVAAGAAPLLFVLAAAARWRRERGADRSAVRRREAARRAHRRLAGADAEHAGLALAGYVADRCGRPEGGMTPAEVRAALEAGGLDPELLDQVSAVLRRADLARYGGVAADGDLAREVGALLGRLERERLG